MQPAAGANYWLDQWTPLSWTYSSLPGSTVAFFELYFTSSLGDPNVDAPSYQMYFQTQVLLSDTAQTWKQVRCTLRAMFTCTQTFVTPCTAARLALECQLRALPLEHLAVE